MGKTTRITVLLGVLIVFAIGLCFNCESVFAVTDATISIELGTFPTLDLFPEHFDSSTLPISVTTTNYTGFSVSLMNPDNWVDLINASDNTKRISPITLPSGSSSVTENNFGYGYGISTDGTNYVPAPVYQESMAIGSRQTSGTETYSLIFGGKVDADTEVGLYNKTFTVVVIVNSPQ